MSATQASLKIATLLDETLKGSSWRRSTVNRSDALTQTIERKCSNFAGDRSGLQQRLQAHGLDVVVLDVSKVGSKSNAESP
jgi:hypothetical protein